MLFVDLVNELLCESGGIGRRARLRGVWATVRVQVPSPAPFFIAGLCKGSTADSDSVCLGSNPSPAAK